jgi:4-hydroxy-tetrahydrodipicolinate synthase
MEQMQRIIDGKPQNFLVISGDDGITVELVKRGGHGVISVAANGFTKPFCDCIHEAMAGNIEEAAATLKSLQEPIDLLFKEGNPTGIKTMTHAMGITRSEVRLPLVEGSEALMMAMEQVIKEKNLR